MVGKRVFDLLAAGAGLIILAPVFFVIAAAIKLSSDGPIVYKATRIGRFGKTFKLMKFRSMVVNADAVGPGITTSGDPRITSVGRVLRKTKLDELPQLVNVFRGEMSIVGPRPEDPRYVSMYTDEQKRVLEVRPGITSQASIVYRHEESILAGENWEEYYVETIMPAKLAIDLDYVNNLSLAKDITIILKTIRALFERHRT